MRSRCGFFLILIALCVTSTSAQEVTDQDPEGKTVTSIEIQGASNINADDLLAKIKTKKGRPFHKAVLDEDIKYLRKTLKLFSMIHAPKPLPWNGGVKVVLIVTENPHIAFVSLLGNLEFSRDQLMEVIETSDGGLADEITLKLDQRRIKDKYLAEGFHFVHVVYQKILDSQFGTTVVFTITEGPDVEIGDVHFTGNDSFDAGELLEVMPSTDESWFFFDTEYVEKDVRADLVQLQRFYRGHGFLDSTVTLVDRRFSADKEKVELYIRIEEGNPYLVGSVTIRGMDRFDQDLVKNELKTQVGGRYKTLFAIADDIRTIREMYYDEAYINVQIRDRSVLPEEGHEVAVILNVVEGDMVVVGDVRIRGNVETRDKVIRRFLEDLAPGRPMNLNTVERARRRILGLGYFDSQSLSLLKPEISLSDYAIFKDAYLRIQDTKRENVKDILVDVEEIDTGAVRFALGAGSNTGLIGTFQYTKENFDPTDLPEGWSDILDAFTGGGQRLELLLAPGLYVSQYSLQYSNPTFMDTDFEFSVRLFKRVWYRENWHEDRLGTMWSIGRRFGNNITASLTYRLELVGVDDIENDAGQIVFDYEGSNLISSLAASFRLTELEFAKGTFSAIGGFNASASYEYAGLGGDIDFHKIRADVSRYWSLFRDSEDRHHVIQLSGDVGWVGESGDSRDVPIYERFFAGGHSSLRGFDFRGVGPMTGDSPDGGKVLLVGSVNYLFPLYEEILRGAAFMDVGTLASDFDSDDLTNFRVSVGFGIRMVVPFLGPQPFALDFGIPLVKDENDRTQVLSFSLERRF